MEPTQASLATMRVLRDGSLFQWYVIPLFALTVYVYAVEVQKRDWSLVLAGLAYWGMDWINEIWNGLLYHFSGHAPAWGLAMPSAYIILIGLNIEISFMFAIAGITFCKTLPLDKGMRILGLPNRLVIASAGSVFCVLVEICLNRAGALVWEWSWWNAGAPWLIFLLGYMPFFLVGFWVHDMKDRRRQVLTVGTIFTVVAVCLVVFIPLGWI